MWNIATGMVFPEDSAKNLLEPRSTGEKLFNEFVQERLINKTKDFVSLILIKYKLQTFEMLSKLLIVSERKTKMSVKSEPYIFQRLLITTRDRKVGMKKVLCYELTALPSSLTRPDGSLNKGVKSQILHELENIDKGVKEHHLAA